jgi:hypothetical protein
MFGLSSPVRIVTSLTVFIFSLLTAVVANAQTPTAVVDKPVAEISTPALKTSPNVALPVAEETAKPAPAAPKAETESVKTETPPATPPTNAAPATATAPATTMTSSAPVAPPAAPPMQQCTRTVKADVVAIPKALMLNRLGAAIPNAFVFALRSDTIGSGNSIQLRPGRRPRPIVLRANVGDCLQIKFTNAIPPSAFAEFPPGAPQPQSPKVGTQEVSLHIQGQEWTASSGDDGSFVGKNSSSLASPSPAPTPAPMPGQTQTYNLFVRDEGTFLLYTMGDTTACAAKGCGVVSQPGHATGSRIGDKERRERPTAAHGRRTTGDRLQRGLSRRLKISRRHTYSCKYAHPQDAGFKPQHCAQRSDGNYHWSKRGKVPRHHGR